MPKKQYPPPRRFNAALSEKACAQLRALNASHHYGDNDLLTNLLENLDSIVDAAAMEQAFAAAYGQPAGSMKSA
jgi:hypothetical protein